MRSDKLYSLLSAFPAMLLIVGLTYYYMNQSAEMNGELLLDESREFAGQFKGVSAVNPGSSDQYYLWINTGSRNRGARMLEAQAERLDGVKDGQELVVTVAPRVKGSKTLWVYQVKDPENNVLEQSKP